MEKHTHTRNLLVLVMIAALALIMVAWGVQRFISGEHRAREAQTLATILETSHQAVNSWGRAHLATATIWANAQEVVAFARGLLEIPPRRQALVHSPLQQGLRERLQPLLDAMGYQGFFIIGPGNINLSSTRDENICVTNLLAMQGDILDKMWGGEAALSLPRRSDVPLPDSRGHLRAGLPTMFAGAPIHDGDGRVMALLTFRINPAEDFTRIFRQGRLGNTGETYAFDRRGLLISESRFDEPLRRSGILGRDEAGILNLRPRNPVIKALAGVHQRREVMLARDMNLDGYLNYRGVPVIGAWLWDEDLGLGIATEIEREEVHDHLAPTHYAVSGLTAFSLLLLFMLSWVFIRSRRELALGEARLRQAQKMEAIGQLTGGIAHDFNNILATILGYATLARDSLDKEQEKQKGYLQEVIQAGERARDLVRQMLDFSRASQGNPVLISLADLVEESVKMLRALLPSSIRIVPPEGGPALPPVWGDPAQLQQVLVNLCINGRDAMQGEGTLTLDMRYLKAGAGRCASCHRQIRGDFVMLVVRDSGCGMNADQQARIFDPFFTTKEVGKGTGMGLSAVHGIVHSHGGHILLESAPGQGSEFRILLPAQEGELPDAGEDREETTNTVAFPARILVVDDEAAIGRFLKELLEGQGYEVEVSEDPRQALARFEADPGEVDLVITDQTMPGMSGLRLAAGMRARRPDLPVILCSGFSDAVDENSAREAGIDAFLTKPIDMNSLLARISELLDRDSRVRGP